MGPKAYPSTKREVPSVVTSLPTWNSVPTAVAAGEKIEEASVAERESKTRIEEIMSLCFKGQF